MGIVELISAKFFIWSYKSFPECNLVPLREGRGWPWNRRLACHTTPEGHITIKPLSRSASPGD